MKIPSETLINANWLAMASILIATIIMILNSRRTEWLARYVERNDVWIRPVFTAIEALSWVLAIPVFLFLSLYAWFTFCHVGFNDPVATQTVLKDQPLMLAMLLLPCGCIMTIYLKIYSFNIRKRQHQVNVQSM